MQSSTCLFSSMALWASRQYGPFPQRLRALLRGNEEPQWLMDVIEQRRIAVREPVIADVLRCYEKEDSVLASRMDNLEPFDASHKSTQQLERDTESVLASIAATSSSSSACTSLSEAELRVYQLWDLMLAVHQQYFTLLLNTASRQSICVHKYADDTIQAPGFRSIGGYSYSDNVTAIMVDVHGQAVRSKRQPMTLYAINFYDDDDDYDFMSAADDAFFLQLIDSPITAKLNQRDSIHRVEPFEGSALEVLGQLCRHEATPGFFSEFLNVAYPGTDGDE